MTDDKVDRVAKAIEYEEFRIVAGRTPNGRVRAMAVAAIAAMKGATPAMIKAGNLYVDWADGCDQAWDAMIDEALK